ncbi:hypothetical protein C8R45DRAFT_1044325 [Mycena sanguinolenta]|nr:hypothetical protein C8R45DRAFT_1044325 [Mycena sanguinolenta]
MQCQSGRETPELSLLCVLLCLTGLAIAVEREYSSTSNIKSNFDRCGRVRKALTGWGGDRHSLNTDTSAIAILANVERGVLRPIRTGEVKWLLDASESTSHLKARSLVLVCQPSEATKMSGTRSRPQSLQESGVALSPRPSHKR